MIALCSLDHHYPRPTGNKPCEELVLVKPSRTVAPQRLPSLFPLLWVSTSAPSLAMLLQHLTHLTPLDQRLPINSSLLLPHNLTPLPL